MARSLVRSRSRKSSALLPQPLYEGMLRLLRIGGGSIVVAIALAAAIALFSYTPRDPSWNTTLVGEGADIVHNLCGLLGAYSADILWQFFGAACFLVPVIVAAWGWRIASGGGLEMFGWRCLAMLGAMIATGVALGALGPSFLLDGGIRDGAFGPDRWRKSFFFASSSMGGCHYRSFICRTWRPWNLFGLCINTG